MQFFSIRMQEPEFMPRRLQNLHIMMYKCLLNSSNSGCFDFLGQYKLKTLFRYNQNATINNKWDVIIMQMRPASFRVFTVIAFTISIFFHILSVLRVYLIPMTIVMILTAGMLISWLQTSHYLKGILQLDHKTNPWKHAFNNLPEWFKYLTYFILVYALVNFLFIMDFKGKAGYFDLSLSFNKLRGLSGFWMAFYLLGLAFVTAFENIDKKQNRKDSV